MEVTGCYACPRNLYECCQDLCEREGEKVELTACPMPGVIWRCLKNHPKK
ncbi:hypothetical protein JAAARDRAFT_117004 [Jaapia argillacea MUCL 33604]|uniref:Cx9C motif-containing protein 4, mitochondrial n=1 Tax=Jaapia argillacea MUCL 33604 TaxID=933084 RepID=A0A067QL44_9AGAM|nr:hypothetical protein JAAARDRAFT_117004 [Jaapia argillacea MUCL 33604]